MGSSKIKRGTNVFLSKEYLQRFYTTEKPKWVLFCERLLNEGYTVLLYFAHNTDSKYITLVKNHKMLKIRYSNHVPNYKIWPESDVKLCVGPSRKGMLSEREVLNVARIFFRSKYLR